MSYRMPYRQVHLDFHTSPAVPSVGERFSREQFAQALKLGHVSSITVFAKCHHGYAYYPSKVNEVHPGLDFDLLSEELAVCKEMGVNAPVYISAGYDEKEAVRHPEWLNVPEPGRSGDFLSSARYHLLCYNTPYMDMLEAEVEEVMERFHPIGVFLDISAVRKCYCSRCVASMYQKGLDPHKVEDVYRHGEMVYAEYCRRVERAVRKYSADATIFHNAGNVQRGRRDIAAWDTHLELESLPTAGWGYDHFPMSAAYVRNLGKEYLGMTGKFHNTWGEFGGFKHPNALRYEASLSLALGAKCSIGDQMHPSGEMNLSTYGLIGKAYAEVEQKEPWCVDARNISDVAVLSADAVRRAHGQVVEDDSPADVGANRMLLEGKYLFDLIDLETPFENYRLLILPDEVQVDDGLAARLKAYLAAGGRLLATGSSGLKPDGTGFAVDLGAEDLGENEFCPSYMVPGEGTEMVNGVTSYVMYSKARNLQPAADAQVFAWLAEPYFNRTPEHFCSHRHTPDVPGSRRPAAVYHGNTAYIGWEIFRDYYENGSLCLKELFLNAMEHLLGADKSVCVENLPDRGVVTLTEQAELHRRVVHLLFAHTTTRGRKTEVIEDAVPLYDVGVRARVPAAPKSVRLVPSGQELKFTYEDGFVRFAVPRMELHAMAELAW